jgi:hypothetical protein
MVLARLPLRSSKPHRAVPYWASPLTLNIVGCFQRQIIHNEIENTLVTPILHDRRKRPKPARMDNISPELAIYGWRFKQDIDNMYVTKLAPDLPFGGLNGQLDQGLVTVVQNGRIATERNSKITNTYTLVFIFGQHVIIGYSMHFLASQHSLLTFLTRNGPRAH